MSEKTISTVGKLVWKTYNTPAGSSYIDGYLGKQCVAGIQRDLLGRGVFANVHLPRNKAYTQGASTEEELKKWCQDEVTAWLINAGLIQEDKT